MAILRIFLSADHLKGGRNQNPIGSCWKLTAFQGTFQQSLPSHSWFDKRFHKNTPTFMTSIFLEGKVLQTWCLCKITIHHSSSLSFIFVFSSALGSVTTWDIHGKNVFRIMQSFKQECCAETLHDYLTLTSLWFYCVIESSILGDLCYYDIG